MAQSILFLQVNTLLAVYILSWDPQSNADKTMYYSGEFRASGRVDSLTGTSSSKLGAFGVSSRVQKRKQDEIAEMLAN